MTKLVGRQWWASIGSPRYVAAPMVDASELPFRLLAREFGTDLCYTPMLHSRLLVEQAGYLEANFSTSAADRPLIAQLCGNDPATVLAAGKRLETRGVDAIDLNLGCPQGIAKRGHYGAFLLDEPDTIVAMVKALAGGLAIPVTCKIRVLPTLEATLALARAIEAAGASMLTVHGRLRTNMKQSITFTDWDIIRQIKLALTIPVTANGSIARREDVAACLAYTGADAVMVSEALLENPGMFSGGWPTKGPLAAAVAAAAGAGAVSGGGAAIALPTGRAPLDQFTLTRRYLEIAEECGYSDIGIAKGHVFKQLYGVWRCFPDLMEQCAARSYTLQHLKTVVGLAEERYREVFAPVIFVEGGGSGARSPAGSEEESGGAGANPGAGAGAPAQVPVLGQYTPALAKALEEGVGVLDESAKEEIRVAWCPPYYLVDPAQPGAWYMRHREGCYEGAEPPHTRGAPDGGLRGDSLQSFRVKRKSRGWGRVEEGGGKAQSGGDDTEDTQPTLAHRLAAFKAMKAEAKVGTERGGKKGEEEEEQRVEVAPPNIWGGDD
jgi:tRNA-dihydrouridine synthase 1